MTRQDLRCEGTLHGVVDDGVLEVKCRRRSCGVRPGVIVLHHFNLHTGELVETLKFQDPRKETADDSASRAAVRPA